MWILLRKAKIWDTRPFKDLATFISATHQTATVQVSKQHQKGSTKCKSNAPLRWCLAPILPDMIEIRVDIIKRVKVSAKGMGDTAFLKEEFVSNLVFWAQSTLSLGTAQDIRDEVQRRIQDRSVGGGHVIASVHNIQGM
jgi:hypothetical protein